MIKYKRFFVVLFVFAALIWLLNAYMGWYGYGKNKYRRSTFGNIQESKNRKVYVRLLFLEPNKEIAYSFNTYIERGFKYGSHSASKTRIIEDSYYPYQLSMPLRDTLNNLSFNILNKENFDSIYNQSILLKEDRLESPIFVQVRKFNETTNRFENIDTLKINNDFGN